MSSFPVLIVEDKDSLRTMLRHALEGHGHAVLEARDEAEAVEQLRKSRPIVVLTDLKLPVGDGFGVLRAAKELDPDLQVVVMTAYGSIQDAVSAMKEGALDFLAKPIDPDHLLLMVGRAIAQRRMLTEYIILKEELAERRGAPRIIGEDGKLRQVSQQLHRAAATDATVLLEGESGTGKELFARALHALSPRADGPFVAINCAAIPETLLETELFGLGWPARHRVVPNAATERWCATDARGPWWARQVHQVSRLMGKLMPVDAGALTTPRQRLSVPLYGPTAPLIGHPESVLDVAPLYAGETARSIHSVVPAAEAVRLLTTFS